MNDKEKAFWVKEPDMVEVVRCKDCKFWDAYYGSEGKIGACGMEIDVHGTSGVWYSDDYCSYGERKDNV